ncbi:DUF1761 domain-containing protein [Amycolatopsis pithecellobii]|uniref:DUF1761 family protein n=1 Tax=Amycolatopsis pithecellobii TaxID=664692 RepID=A0A6N7YRT9_9PSEU|nr:DUF1761 domain-containing protein [Amycolatopsis pithecellobii]MTD55745.1 DUF1761 family protein [Amycolatopsis pithecellobii]
MFAVFPQINWIAVVVSTVVLSGLGAAYFMVAVPQQYARVLGREGAPAPERRTVDGVGPLVCNLINVLASAVLFAALGITSVGDALVFGVIVGVGYLVAMTFNIAINPNFPHPLRYGLLNAPYFLVSSVLTSLALVLI